jgi:hypothetical protein
MADQKLSQLTPAATPTGGELVYVVQNGVQRRTTTQAVANLAGAAITVAIAAHDAEADPHNGASPTFADLTLTGLLTAPHIHGSLAGDIYVHVKNTSGGTLAANTAVYATGSVGDTDRIEVAACDPTDPAKMPAIGLLTTTLANNAEGDAIILGELRPTNTSIYTLGDELYVGAGGALVSAIPASGAVQRVGSVARVQADTGTIVVGLGAAMSQVGFTGAYSDLSGKPTVPTAADAIPQPLGTAAIGASVDYAREDHVHAMPSAADVGADAAGTASSAISAHEAAADPHPGYALESSLATVATSGAYNDLSGKPALVTALDGLSDVTLSSPADQQVLKYDAATGQWINAASPGGGGGTVTSVGFTAPTGFNVSGSPITTSGTIALSYAAGYQGYTSTEAGKLAGIEPGAEVNVNPDWNATSGDAQILNKPTLGTAAALDVGTTAGTVAAGDDARFHDPVTLAASVADVLGLTGQQLTADDPGADRLIFWDDSAGKLTHLTLGANLSITGTTLDASGGAGATDLSYDAATRVLSSSTGTDATLPLFTSTEAGLAPSSGGGTTNFLRADGTWAAPAGGGGTVINPGYTSGNLIAPPTYKDGAVSSTPVVGLPTLACIYIPEATTFSGLITRTWSNYSGTSTIQLGIYDHDKATNGPKDLIYTSGDLTFTGSVNSNYGPAGFSQTLQPGFYWLAFLAISNAATPNFFGPASNSAGLGAPWHVEFTPNGQPTTIGRTNAGGYTALPANLIGNFRTDAFTRPIPMLVA